MRDQTNKPVIFITSTRLEIELSQICLISINMIFPWLCPSRSTAVENCTRKIEEVMDSSRPVAINDQLTSQLQGLTAPL